MVEVTQEAIEEAAPMLDNALGFPCSEAQAERILEALSPMIDRLAKAAIRAMLDGVESNLSAVQYDPAPYTAMKHRIAAMRKDVE